MIKVAWAILEVFYSTGIRRSELANLAVTDIDADRGEGDHGCPARKLGLVA